MDWDSEVLDELEAYIDAYLEEMAEKYKDNKAALDKLSHIKNVTSLAKIVSNDDRMAIISAKFHDIGRFKQLELLGSFNDGILLHHYIGEDVVTRAVFNRQLSVSKELNAIRQVVQYHGRQAYIPYKPELAEGVIGLIDVISRVDGIENGCIGATGYLVREAETDAKGYRENNPDLDMKSVSPEVWEFYSKGQKFDKLKYCKTYADYTLFAAILAIEALKGKDRDVARIAMDIEANGYESALAGYKNIFSKLVAPEYADKAFEVLNGYYQSKDYVYGEDKKSDEQSGMAIGD